MGNVLSQLLRRTKKDYIGPQIGAANSKMFIFATRNPKNRIVSFFSRKATLELVMLVHPFVHNDSLKKFLINHLPHQSSFSPINFLINHLYSSLAQLLATFKIFRLV